MVIPGFISIGSSPTFVISNVRHPVKPGCTPVAVAMINPLRPQEDLPITEPLMSAGKRSHSKVTPKTKLRGCKKNDSPSGTK